MLTRKPLPLALAALFVSPAVFAVGVGNEAQLETIDVDATRTHAPLVADLPNTSASKTAQELDRQNLVNPEDALRYVPNTTIRKRYIGDRNALIGGRNFGTLQPQRALVYLGDMLISNFLGRFDAPRWNMVTPEAIERVDVLYGPYSALYPGNSIGTTVVISEKAPDALEGSVRLTGHTQDFKAYGYSERFNGGQLSGYLGTRFDSGLWTSLTVNHQDATSHPMQYSTQLRSKGTPGAAGIRVGGIRYDTDPFGAPRAVFGANSGAIDHTIQDTAKLKFGYTFTPQIEATGLIGLWANDTTNRNRTFLRDTAGNPVWGGTVNDGTTSFDLPGDAFVPSDREETHRQLGATLKTRYATGWNGSIVLSNYEILDDVSRTANLSEPAALVGGPGSVTRRDGTGWTTFEIQALYKPVAGDFGDGRHTLTFGYHHNAYDLNNLTRDASDWRNTETTLSQRFTGTTTTQALYAQDSWQLADAWKLTAGLRYERFEASDGEQTRRVNAPCLSAAGDGFAAVCSDNGDGSFNRSLVYDTRTLSAASPKLSLAWTARDDLLLRASYGRGVRFPNVEELYNATITPTAQTTSDPNLKPEKGDAFELAGEWFAGDDTVRVSLFYDEVEDAILRQLDIQASLNQNVNIQRINNVDLQRTVGVEFAWNAQRLAGIDGLSLDASLAFTRSKVEENSLNPASEGKYWLRVPKTRGNLLLAYQLNSHWRGSLGYRHEGRAYAAEDNSDINPDVFGAVSRVNQLDARVTFSPTAKIDLSLGVDNLTNDEAFQFHPYPQRTAFFELKAKL